MAVSLESVRRQLKEYAKDDGDISDGELNKLATDLGLNDDTIDLGSGQTVKLSTFLNSIKTALESGQPLDTTKGLDQHLEQLIEQLGPLAEQVAVLEEKVKDLEQQLRSATDAEKQEKQRQLNEARVEHAMKQGKLQGLLDKATSIARDDRSKLERLQDNWYRAANMQKPATGTVSTNAKALTSGGGGGGAQGAGAGPSGGAGKAQGFNTPASWGAQTYDGPQFSSDAYVQSLATDDFVLQSFDDVLKNQNRGRQLMMLFHYFAQRAASGDLGQMYQFMKFLTYIISKDKSKQMIDMGRKLIELQDEARRVTDVLVNTKSDASDPNANNDFLKTMTWAKSQSDAIATSQKLIAQMMEEFATIVETLTNTTKGALEAWSRVLRTVSRIGG